MSYSGKTLKSIFEDPDIPKCLGDVRNDAEALWALYHVGLAGVTDIQFLEMRLAPAIFLLLFLFLVLVLVPALARLSLPQHLRFLPRFAFP